jgi:hypothetical protein
MIITAALGGSIYYGEQRRLDKKAENKAREKSDTRAELEHQIKLAETAINR